MFNSRHPDPRRVWKEGSEQHLLTQLLGIPRAPQAPRAPRANSKKLRFEYSFVNLTHFSVKDVQFSIKLPMWPKGSPKRAKGSPRAGQRHPKAPEGRPEGAQGFPKESKRSPKSAQRKPKAFQRHPKEAKGKRYISQNSKSTAQVDVMLILTLLKSSFCLQGLPVGGIHFQDSDLFEQFLLSAGCPLLGNPFSEL